MYVMPRILRESGYASTIAAVRYVISFSTAMTDWPCVGEGRILPLYSVQILKDDKRRWNEGSWKPLLCILSCEKTQSGRGKDTE